MSKVLYRQAGFILYFADFHKQFHIFMELELNKFLY